MRRPLRLVGITAAVFATVLGVAFVLRGVFLAPLVRGLVVGGAESQGLRIAAGRVGGSYWSDLVLEDIRTLEPSGTGPVKTLQAARLRFEYRPLSLLSGLEGFVRNARVRAEGVRARIDLRQPAKERPSATDGPVRLPTAIPSFQALDVAVEIDGPGFSASVQGASVEAAPPAGGRDGEVHVRADRVRVAHPALRETGPVSLDADLRYSEERLIVRELRVANETAAEGVQIDFQPEGVVFDGTLRLFGGTQRLAGTVRSGLWEVRWTVDGLDLGQASSILALPFPLEGDLASRGELRIDPDRPAKLEGRADLRLARFRAKGLALDEGFLSASAAEGTVRIEEARARSASNSAAVTDAALPSELLFEGDFAALSEIASGTFSIDARDIPSVLTLFGLEGLPGPFPDHSLRAEGSASGGRLSISHAELKVGARNRASLRRWNVPIRPLFEKAWSQLAAEGSGELSADLQDVPAVLRLLRIEPPKPSPTLLRLEAAAEGGILFLSSAEARMVEANSATIRGVSLPLRALIDRSWRELADRTSGQFSAALKDVPSVVRLIRPSLEVDARPVPRHLLVLDGTISKGEASISRASLDAGQATVRIREGSVALPIAGRTAAQSPLKARVEIDAPRLEPLAAALGLPRAGGSLKGSLTAGGTLAAPSGSFDLRAAGLSLSGHLVGNVSARGDADSGTVRVRSLEIRRGGDRLSGRGEIEIESRSLRSAALDLAVADVAEYSGLLPGAPELGGKLVASIQASGPWAEPDAKLRGSLSNGRVGAIEVEAAELDAEATGRTIRVRSLRAETSAGRASLSGELTRRPEGAGFSARLDSLAVSRGSAELSLVHPAEVSYIPSRELAVKGLDLAGSEGQLHLNGRFVASGGSDATLEASVVRSAGWLDDLTGEDLSVRGASVRAHLTGSAAQPELAAQGRVEEIVVQGAPFSLTAAFEIQSSPRGIRIPALEISGGESTRFRLSGEIPLDLVTLRPVRGGTVGLTGRLEVGNLADFASLMPSGLEAKGAVTGDLEISGSLEAPNGSIRLQGEGLELLPSKVPVPPGPLDLSAHAVVRGDRITLEDLRVTSPALSLTGSGEWTGARVFAPPRERGDRLSGRVSARTKLEMPDVGWVARSFPAFQRVAGRLSADLSVEGTIREPQVTGSLHLAGGELVTTGPMPPLDSLALEAVATPTEIRIEALSGELGSAPFRASGQIRLQGGSGPELEIRLDGESLLFVRSEELIVRADTSVRAVGPISAIRFEGQVALTEGRLAKNIDFLQRLIPFRKTAAPAAGGHFELFSFRDPPLRDSRFDVRIVSQQPFEIRSNVARGKVRPELTLGGTGQIPVLLGNVYVDEATVALPAGRLTAESGVIRFLESDPDRPVLDILARTSMMGYDITVRAEGPYDEPVVTLSSVPSLPNQQLLMLLLTGQPPQAPTSTAGTAPSAVQTARRGGLAVGGFVGKNLLSKLFGNQTAESDQSVLDRFHLQVGPGVTATGQETVEAEFELAKGVFLKGDTLYLQAERDVYGAYNAGARIVFRFR